MIRILAVLLVVALFLAVLPAQEDRELKVLDKYKELNWAPYMALTPRISGPGLVVSELPLSDDEGFIKSVQKILDEYDYGRSYNLNEFDCSNSSQIA